MKIDLFCFFDGTKELADVTFLSDNRADFIAKSLVASLNSVYINVGECWRERDAYVGLRYDI